jgi:uncharacterized protein YaiE (UPF0345 family)
VRSWPANQGGSAAPAPCRTVKCGSAQPVRCTRFNKEIQMSNQFDHVSISKKANIYFDGKCISYSLTFPDQTKKTVGVIMPGSLTFSTDAPEVMEIVDGKCRARIGADGEWNSYGAGQQFRVPGKSSFEIEVQEIVSYVCHFHNQ